jgi:hypothetical protein
MPWSLLFTSSKNNINNLDTSSNSIQTSIELRNKDEEEEEEEYNWRELTIAENDVC